MHALISPNGITASFVHGRDARTLLISVGSRLSGFKRDCMYMSHLCVDDVAGTNGDRELGLHVTKIGFLSVCG